MDIQLYTNPEGRRFASLTDFAKEYEKKLKKKFNTSQAVKSIPSYYLEKTRGRNGTTFLDIEFLPYFFSTKRNIPTDLVQSFIKEINVKIDRRETYGSLESIFIDNLEGFFKTILPTISIKRQYQIGDFFYDACIENKILIEFDESHHKYNKKNDIVKSKVALKNQMHLIRVSSNSNYGKEIAKIYKIYKTKVI